MLTEDIHFPVLVQAQSRRPSEPAQGASSTHRSLQLPLRTHQPDLAFAGLLDYILSQTLRLRPDPYLRAPVEEGIAGMVAPLSKYAV